VLGAKIITLTFIIFELLPFVIFQNVILPELISKSVRGVKLNPDKWIGLRRRSVAQKNDNLPCNICQLLPFVIFCHHCSHTFQIFYHFSHQFSLQNNLLKLNYSCLLHIFSSNKQICLARGGHVNVVLF
jgi:hypothetical protein